MQNSTQQTHSQSKSQHTTSRLLQSIIHTYHQGQNNQSSVTDSRATIHEMNQEDLYSYRSNNSEKQQSRIIELIEKKESQLKTLETFLIKEFQQINQNKEKHAKIKVQLENISYSITELKASNISHKTICQELELLKQSMTSQVSNLLYTLLQEKQTYKKINDQAQLFIQRSSKAFEESRKIYEDQISHLKSLIQKQELQINDLHGETNQKSKEIAKLHEELAQNPMTNQSEPFKLQEEHLNRPIDKKQSLKNLSDEELQVSFSADKNTKAKQLVNAILHLKSNQSLLNIKEDGELRISSQSAEEEQQKPENGQKRSLTRNFILLKGSNSSQSENDKEFLENQEARSPAERSEHIQTSEVRRINSSANQVGNDASSAINKLDVFSELNQVELSQEDNISCYREYEDENYSEIEFKNMRKAKISRSMKATRNAVYNGQTTPTHTEDRHSEFRIFTESVQPEGGKSKIPQTLKPKLEKQNLKPQEKPSVLPKHESKTDALEESLHKKVPTPSREEHSPKDSLESPDKKKKHHRYNYCRLYEEQQIKEIENINSMCNHLILNEKPSSLFYPKELTPSRKARELSPTSPRRSSFSKLEASRFNIGSDLENYQKTFVRSGAPNISSFSNSKKPLTIDIPASPQRTQPLNEKVLPNPYLRLQNHIHQISCQEFSPSRSRYMNERTSNAYLDRCDNKSRTSYTDLKSQIRGQNLRDQFLWDPKPNLQNTPSQNRSNYEEHIISNNADRKEYIKSKIQMIKKKNSTQNNPVSKSPNKISFLKSQEPENYLSKQQLQRPLLTKPISRNHNRSTYENQEPVKGYDFTEDKFEKEIMEKSRRTDKSQLQNSTISRLDKSKDVSRVSYVNGNNNLSYSKNEKTERLGQISTQNLRRLSSNVASSQEDQYNDIHQQLNYSMTPQSEISEAKGGHIQQSVSKKPLNRPVEHARQSVSPLKPTSRNTNSLYMPHNGSWEAKKQPVVSEYHGTDSRYNQGNLYKHPYIMDRKKTKETRGTRNDEDISFENNQMFRRF